MPFLPGDRYPINRSGRPSAEAGMRDGMPDPFEDPRLAARCDFRRGCRPVPRQATGPAKGSAALEAHGDTHAAADAERREALLGVAAAISKRSVLRTRAPEAPIGWPIAMAPPLTLTMSGFQPRSLLTRAGLGREGLVGLDEVEVVDRPAGLPSQRLARGRDRAPSPSRPDRRRPSPRRRCARAASGRGARLRLRSSAPRRPRRR